MIIKTASFFSFILFVAGCIRTREKIENPYEVARNYCSCIESKMNNFKDSLIDIYDCEKKIFAKSRMMQISYSGDVTGNSKLTLDSAFNFVIQVRNITDTMCINKLDPKKIKKKPHVRM
jgi:hypothetical protein